MHYDVKIGSLSPVPTFPRMKIILRNKSDYRCNKKQNQENICIWLGYIK